MFLLPKGKDYNPRAKLIFQTIIFLCVFFVSIALYSIKILRIQTHFRTNLTSIEKLGSFPYTDWVPVTDISQKSGVTVYKPEMCFNGINIYAAKAYREAYLIDMEGNILHTWSNNIQDSEDWAHIKMCKNGDLLAIVRNNRLNRLDWDSDILWEKKLRFHHDLAVDDLGNIWSIINKDRIVMTSSAPISILDNSIVVLTPDGKIFKEIPLYELFRHRIPTKTFWNVFFHIFLRYPGMIRGWFENGFFFNTDMKLNIFHNNTVTLIYQNIEGLCKKGDILISVRELDTIAIMSRKTEKIIWEWGPGELDRQHHPTLLDNGNILIFDNGPTRGFSRVIEVNPLSRKIEWEFKAHPPEKFYSVTRGASQRLPNGNTLITESNKGHVFEVTKNGEIVWDFYSPQTIKRAHMERAIIYRMMRITSPEKYPKLKNLQ
jgi:hypothetical protein